MGPVFSTLITAIKRDSSLPGFLLCCLLLLPQTTFGRSLHWQEMAVQARLDRDGRPAGP